MAEYVFTEMSPAQLEGLWMFISPGAEEIFRRWKNNVDWVPQDLYRAIKKDRATCNFIYKGKDRIGFIVTRNFRTEFDGKAYQHIWLAYLYPEYRGQARRVLPEAMAYLERQARRYQARYIEMDTARPGWTRLLEQQDFRPHRTVYRKELSYGR